MPSQEQDHSTSSQPVGAGDQHDTDFLHGLLRPVHESWHGLLLDALRRMDGNFLRSLNTHRDWLPGAEKCFAAFSVPRDRVRVVWLGESPYPSPERSAGISFYDASVDRIFDPGDGLRGFTKKVNDATSLRNILKAWFVAIGRLQMAATNKDHIRNMNKEGLIQNLDELFRRGKEAGWLWLNTGLSLRPNETKQPQIEAWHDLICHVLLDVSNRGAMSVLLGSFSDRFRCLVGDRIMAPHPRNEDFLRCENIHAFLRGWNFLVEDAEDQRPLRCHAGGSPQCCTLTP